MVFHVSPKYQTNDKHIEMTSMEVDTDEVVEATPKLGIIDQVTMHPLVLLSAADHYHRVARGTKKRVVGILLGMVSKGVVDCTNSFAVPFEEDSRNPVSVEPVDITYHGFASVARFSLRLLSFRTTGRVLLGS